MRWHSLTMSMDRTGTGSRIWKLLWEASVAGEAVDDGNAIFMTRDGGGRMVLYFPPSARLLATTVGAARCAKPAPDGLALLAGRERAWDVHFWEPDTLPLPWPVARAA